MTDPATPASTQTYKGTVERERDAGLVARTKSGDREAFGMLVRHYERPIFNFMVRHRLDRTTAADLTQEAFLKAFRSIDSFRPERASFKTWLYTISYNLIRDNARRMDVRSRGAEELQRAHEAAPPRRTHADEVADSDEAERLLALVDEEARELLVLRFLQEIPYNEISEITGMPAATLRSKVHRALKRLQGQLDERQEAGS